MAETSIGGEETSTGHVDEMHYTEAALARDMAKLREEDALGEDAVGRLFAGLAEATVDKRPGLRDRLRELSTPVRILLAVAGALVMATVALLVTGVRADLTGQAILRYGIAMAAIAGFMGAAFAVSLRGMHRRPLGRAAWLVVVVMLAVPLVLAVMPWIWDTPDPPAAMAGMGHMPCLLLGLVTGALTAAVAWVFQRQDVSVLWRLVAAVAGGGLTAFAMLQLHCPSTDASHLLIGHAGVGLILAAAVATVVYLRQRSA